MNPIRMVSLREQMIGVTLRELRKPLGRTGQELVHHGVHLTEVTPPGQGIEGEGLCRQGRDHRATPLRP